MFVIMGATGRVGGAVLDAFAATGHPVRAISRTAQPARNRIDWIHADAFDAVGLAQAFSGADAVFLMNPVSAHAADVYDEAARLSAATAEALRIAAVPYAVALSSQGAHLAAGTGVVRTLHDFEQRLGQTQTRLTFLRPAYFMESWAPLTGIAAQTGQLPTFLHPTDRPIPTVSARDVGHAAADYLLHPVFGVVNLVGPRQYSEEDVATILSQLLGRDIRMSPIPQGAIAPALQDAGLGASMAAETAALYDAINGGAIPFADAPQRTCPTPLDEILRNAIPQQRSETA